MKRTVVAWYGDQELGRYSVDYGATPSGETATDDQLLKVVRMTMGQAGISDAQVAAAELHFVD